MQLSVKDIADNANMIINRYAYTKDGDYIRVLNLNCLNNAAVIYNDEIIETNMDDIEIQIVLDYQRKLLQSPIKPKIFGACFLTFRKRQNSPVQT